MFPHEWPQGVQAILSPDMFLWGVGYAILGGLLAWLFARYRSSLIQRKKLQDVVELAGAACHELNQPMQVIFGYADIVREEIEPDDPFRQPLTEIVDQILHMDKILIKENTQDHQI